MFPEGEQHGCHGVALLAFLSLVDDVRCPFATLSNILSRLATEPLSEGAELHRRQRPPRVRRGWRLSR